MTQSTPDTGRTARFFIDKRGDLQLTLTLTDGRVRAFRYACSVPLETAGEEALVNAFTETVGNLLACLGGQSLTVCSGRDRILGRIPEDADRIIRAEKGCARAIRVADRINAALGLPPFSIQTVKAPFPAPEDPAPVGQAPLAELLRKKAAASLRGIRLGIDVGGTDIKAVAFRDGQLAAIKEFDWSPAEYSTPEEITGPIVWTAKLLIAAAVCTTIPAYIVRALRKEATADEMRTAAKRAGDGLKCAGIGLSYPDVVIRDRIVGGETPKTKGLQQHDPAHYEEALQRLAALKEELSALLEENGTLHMANDGNIAAYTAAVELSFSSAADEIDRGVFAHSLGTDLGTGLVLGDGTFPEAPLEIYTFRTGSEEQNALRRPPADIRSARTVHSGLRGAERRVGQAAAFRYAYALAPALTEGYTEEADGIVRVITAPEDKRKALREHLMACADSGDTAAEEVFVRIGRALADITLEAEALLETGMDKRYLFGRFVKRAHVFRLIEKGFCERCPDIKLVSADNTLANSPLMRALAADGNVTVAQFGQAVGAVYYGA